MSHMPELETTTLPEDAVEVGRIADAWGVKGWFKIIAFSADPQALLTARQWFLLPPEKGGKPFAGILLLPVKQARIHSGSIVGHSMAVTDRNAAEALRGARIFVAREHFPQTEENEYYWVDLLGLRVVNREGMDLGQVRELLATGPQTVLVLSYEDAGKERERMIPFVDAYIDNVDRERGIIVADWQPDY